MNVIKYLFVIPLSFLTISSVFATSCSKTSGVEDILWDVKYSFVGVVADIEDNGRKNPEAWGQGKAEKYVIFDVIKNLKGDAGSTIELKRSYGLNGLPCGDLAVGNTYVVATNGLRFDQSTCACNYSGEEYLIEYYLDTDFTNFIDSSQRRRRNIYIGFLSIGMFILVAFVFMKFKKDKKSF